MYHATWCNPCKAVKPQFQQASNGYLKEMGVMFELVDIDEAPNLTADAGVRSVPTIIATIDGEDHWITSRTAPKMELEIERLLAQNG
jgi:thiol-disulfide isomerase/thioredoxin